MPASPIMVLELYPKAELVSLVVFLAIILVPIGDLLDFFIGFFDGLIGGFQDCFVSRFYGFSYGRNVEPGINRCCGRVLMV